MSRFKRAISKAAALALDKLPRPYVNALAELINKRHAAGQPAGDVIIEMMLRHATDPAAAINDLESAVSVDDILFGMNRLAEGRHAAMNGLFESASTITNPVLRTAVELWQAESNGTVLSEPDLVRLLEASRGVSGRGQRRVELLLLHSMLRAERVDLAERLLASSDTVSLEELPPPYKVGILRCVLKRGPDGYGAMRQKIGAGMTSLDRLRILELDVASGYVAVPPDHGEIVGQFLQAAPAGVARDFREAIKPFYNAHDTRLMNARIDGSAAADIVDQIKSAVANTQALSLIRLGDGEAYCYGQATTSALDDNKRRERHWWGCELDAGLRDALQAELREAIANADILGVPSVHRFIRDTSYLTKDLKSAASARGLMTIMANVQPKAGAKLVEDRIHQVLFGRHALLDLARAAPRTVVISSLRPDIVDGAFPNAVSIAVPTHDKTRTNDAFVRGTAPLPHVYKDVIVQIRSTVREGDLALVGAGIIGKIFIREASRQGAVALDVGSMLDYLAGAKTRSVADLV